MADLTQEFESFSELDELRGANRRLQYKLARAQAKTDELVEAVYRAAKDSLVTLGRPTRIDPPAKDKRRAGAEVALAHVTDWQYGKQTESYSPAIAEDRIGAMAKKVVRLTEIQRADHPVKKAHVFLGGDMTEGVSIFPGQAHEVEMHLFEQLFGAARLTESFVRQLLVSFDDVEVDEVPGNHGRLGKKGEMPRSDNTDRFLYQIVRDRFKDEPRVKWNSNPTWYVVAKIGNYRPLLVHGDQIKSFGGNVPAYGIMKKFSAWAGGVIEPFHDGYLGHLHQNMELTMPAGGRIFMTGSPESGNEYAREFVAARGRPSQRLHFVNPERGMVTCQYVCWLDQ